MKILATTVAAIAFSAVAGAALAQSVHDNPVTNNENYSEQGSNAPGYAGYGHPSPDGYATDSYRAGYGANAGVMNYGTPSTNNENWTSQGSNAPGYGGFGHPSGMYEGRSAYIDR